MVWASSIKIITDLFVQWLCSGLTLAERNEKLEAMGAKYVKIDVGDLIILEDGSTGFIISQDKRYPLPESKNPCKEIPLGSPQYCSLIPLKGFKVIKARIKGNKPEPVFSVRFPLSNTTQDYFAREIAHNVRIGKWKLFKKGKSHETKSEETS